MAIPLSVLILLLTLLSTITSSTTFSGASNGTTPSSYLQTASAGGFELFLWVLVSGGIVGALSGMYEVSQVKMVGSTLRYVLSIPLLASCKPFFILLDKLSRYPDSTPRSTSRTLLYGAFLGMLLLVLISIFVGISLISLNQILTLDLNIRLRDILSVVLIALPGLLLRGAIGTAIATDPEDKKPRTPHSNMQQISY